MRHPDVVEGDEGPDITKPILGSLIAQLKAAKLVSEENQLTNGAKKWSGWVKLPGRAKTLRRIDIRLAPWNAYPYMLLGSSGDAMLMKFLRARAKHA